MQLHPLHPQLLRHCVFPSSLHSSFFSFPIEFTNTRAGLIKFNNAFIYKHHHVLYSAYSTVDYLFEACDSIKIDVSVFDSQNLILLPAEKQCSFFLITIFGINFF